MSKKIYDKAPLSIQDQINLLENRGLTIENKTKAAVYLSEISYYRLSAYFLPYQKVNDTFNPGTTFEQIIKTYSFDRELRLLVFDCIERIEVAIRTQFVYHMSTTYSDSHWQDKPSHYIKPYYNGIGNLVDPYSDFQSIINRAKTARRPEVYIKHYMTHYDKPSNPPAWMCFELLTMGDLSYQFKGLQKNSDQKAIAGFFDVHHKVFASWMHTLTYVRNLCAHHSRLWNRDLAIEPEKLLKPIGNWVNPPFDNNKRIFYFICVLKYLLLRSNPSNSLKDKLDNLFKKYAMVPVKYMGIPSDAEGNMLDWKNEPLWN